MCVYSSYVCVCIYIYIYLQICVCICTLCKYVFRIHTHSSVFHIEYKTISPLFPSVEFKKNSQRRKIPTHRQDIIMGG